MTHIVRALPLWLAAILIAAVITAGCAEIAPRPCPACPTAAPEPAPAAEAVYAPVAFSAIPGWQGAELLPGLRAFVAGCPWIAASGALGRACEAARAAPAQSETEARRFIEATFTPWSVRPSDGSVDGLVTGYYE